MANSNLQNDVLSALLQIKRDGPKRKKIGLCQNITDVMPNAWGVHHTLEELFKTWPLHSGDIIFPVPCPDKEPDVAYCNFTGNMWDKRTAYGSNRWNLLEHCIQQLSQEEE